MIEAVITDRNLIIEILTQSFDSNKSVDYVIKGGAKRKDQIKALMEYAFDICIISGDVYLSDNKKACALILLPHNKKLALNNIALNIKFLLFSSSIKKIWKVLKREMTIQQWHPENKYAHLWFLGVSPEEQRKGHGSKLVTELTEYYSQRGLPIYLETSTLTNIPWYKKHGFVMIQELNLDYSLFILKKEISLKHAIAWN